MEWNINIIKNKNSKYDFRLVGNNYSEINFFKHSYFRILVSLSSYLSQGNIFCKDFFKIKYSSRVPAIFDFSIDKNNTKPDKYLTINKSLQYFEFIDKSKKEKIYKLSLNDTKIFSSLFFYNEVSDINQFIRENINAYKHTNNIDLFLTTGWVKFDKNKKYFIIDLLKYDKTSKKTILTRCKIFDKKIVNQLVIKKNISSYCIVFISFNNFFSIKNIIPITYDEYITYIYDLMLPYKYDFNDINYSENIMKPINYKNNDIERYAFAIDPTGSKDRDDAISCFFYNNNKMVFDNFKATHIKLIVHISDTLNYIKPNNKNYYYHYCKYKCNTDYLDKFNLPMMDRILSEEILSLDGDKNNAISISLTYKIIDKYKFIIKQFPEEVKVNRSNNVNVFGTTYKKFSESYGLEPKKFFDNKNFTDRLIINCNKKIKRDINQFIYEGESKYPNEIKRLIANNLKQLYIYFVNSLNHTGKDTLIKIPSNLVREKHFKKSNIFLEFSPVEMWSHSLIEYTALESNIYFSYLMYLKSINKISKSENTYIFDYKTIIQLNEELGKKNVNLILNNFINDKKVKSSYHGLYRNLYSPGKKEFYLNEEIRNLLLKLNKSSSNNNELLEKFFYKFEYKFVKNKINTIIFFKILLALREILLLLNSKSNLEISTKLISKELKMKAKYETFPVSHLDICSLLYTHATSPMRRFIDINVHHLIFNSKSSNYIKFNVDIDGLNNSVNIGKFIHQLVNSNRFIELITFNDKLILTAELIDKKKNLIGFNEIINFYSFNENFKVSKNKVLIKMDSYNLPTLKIVDQNKKTFNIFFHMLRKESENIRNKCQILLEKIFLIKKVKYIC